MGAVMLEQGEVADGYWHEVPDLGWLELVELVHSTLGEIDDLLASERQFPGERLERLLQGPLSDSNDPCWAVGYVAACWGVAYSGGEFFCC